MTEFTPGEAVIRVHPKVKPTPAYRVVAQHGPTVYLSSLDRPIESRNRDIWPAEAAAFRTIEENPPL